MQREREREREREKREKEREREKRLFWTFSIDEHVRRDGTGQRHKYTCNFECFKLDKLTSDPSQTLILTKWTPRGKAESSNVRLGSKSSKLNFLFRDKILFVGAQTKVTPVAHGGRSCLWARYRCPPSIIVGKPKRIIDV
jgi:hypothetical protein